mgnify:CR=1 FL=1
MGIDPGTNYMGYGVLEVCGREVRSVVLGDIDLHRMNDPYEKLRYIFERVGALVDEYRPPRGGPRIALLRRERAVDAQAGPGARRGDGCGVEPRTAGIRIRPPHASNSVSRPRLGPPRSRSRLSSAACSRSNVRPGDWTLRTVWPSPCATIHEFEPIERRPRRRSVQRTRRRPQGCLGKGQFELGTVFEG